jgi:hypothetical protein
MSDIKVNDIIGANTTQSQKEAGFELGTSGRTTDGKTAVYVKAGGADIAPSAYLSVDSVYEATAVTSGAYTAVNGGSVFKAGEYGFVLSASGTLASSGSSGS